MGRSLIDSMVVVRITYCYSLTNPNPGGCDLDYISLDQHSYNQAVSTETQ